jgi:sulfonate transport system substrate-binding protein
MTRFVQRLAGALGLAAIASGLIAQQAAAEDKAVRIGYQKTGILTITKQQGTIEKRLAGDGVTVSWVQFPSGPPLLEALNAGSIDFGYTGDAPPIFAQAAGADLVYIAASPADGVGEALIVKPDSPVRTVAELKGKRIGLTKGSSAHNFLIVALERAGVKYDEITPVFLAPADAAAAFANGSIDAWAIWDPFLAIAEQREKARSLIAADAVLDVNSYLLASRSFAVKNPKILNDIVGGVREAADWANANRDKVAAAFSETTGVDIAAQTVAVGRAQYGVLPLTDAVIASQQETADRFHKLGLIPKPILVRDAIWVRTPNS